MCDHKNAQRRDLERHILVYHSITAAEMGILPQNVTCPVDDCGQRFTRKDNMVRHQRIKHSDQK